MPSAVSCRFFCVFSAVARGRRRSHRFGVRSGTLRPPESIVNTMLLVHFHVFAKTPKIDAPGTRFRTQNRRKSTPEAPKSPKFPEKVDFLTVRFLTVFSSTEKNEKKTKKEVNRPVLIRNDGLRRVRRRGKERQALRETGMESGQDLTRQHPGGVRRL